jgi:hypothetical protein
MFNVKDVFAGISFRLLKTGMGIGAKVLKCLEPLIMSCLSPQPL